MKYLFSTSALVIMLSVFHTQSTSQETNKSEFNLSKTEVNIAVANIFAKNNLWYLMYADGEYLPLSYDTYFVQPELIIGMKFHGKSGAFRVGTNFKYSNVTNKNDGGKTEEYTYKNFGSALYIGYEWHKTFSRVMIYYGFDLSANYLSFHSKHKYQNSFQNSIIQSEYTYKESAFGINPLLGLNVFITPHLSIGTEVKLSAEYVTGNTESKSSSSSIPNKDESSGFRTRIGPLGFLSVNIYF